MKGQLRYLNQQGFNCTVVTSQGENTKSFSQKENCNIEIVNMEREISLLKDMNSLIKMIILFFKEKPHIVNAGTPKAGLLMMIAAFITRVPIRIYTLRGLRLETTRGVKRKVLSIAEKVAMFCSTETLAISPSLRDKAIEYKLIKPDKIRVLGIGSSNGINIEKFSKTESTKVIIKEIQEKYNIADEDFVIGFVGRITKDKGIDDIVKVFEMLLKKNYKVKLLIVGEFDNDDPILITTKKTIENHPRIIHVGFQKNPVPYYYLMKVFLFLTKREGFGNVSIEAALTELPVIVNNVTGAKDTVINNKTGYIIDENSLEEIKEKIITLYEDRELQRNLGNNGAKWVSENFAQKIIHSKLYCYYAKKLEDRNIDL